MSARSVITRSVQLVPIYAAIALGSALGAFVVYEIVVAAGLVIERFGLGPVVLCVVAAALCVPFFLSFDPNQLRLSEMMRNNRTRFSAIVLQVPILIAVSCTLMIYLGVPWYFVVLASASVFSAGAAVQSRMKKRGPSTKGTKTERSDKLRRKEKSDK